MINLKTTVGVSVGSLLLLIAAVWQGPGMVIAWADQTFVTDAEIAQLQIEVKEAVDTANETNELVTDYIKGERIDELRKTIEGAEDLLVDLDFYEKENGVNSLTRDRRSELKRRITRAEDELDCIKRGGKNCGA